MSTKADKHFTTTTTLFCFINQQRTSNIARLKGYHLLAGKPLNLEVHICICVISVLWESCMRMLPLFSERRENDGQYVDITNFRTNIVFLEPSSNIKPIQATVYILLKKKKKKNETGKARIGYMYNGDFKLTIKHFRSNYQMLLHFVERNYSSSECIL